MKERIIKEIALPENIQCGISGNDVKIKGTSGTIEKNFLHNNIIMESREGKILVGCDKATRKEKKIIGTIVARIKNMIEGLQKPFEYKLQVCSVHFPMNVSVSPNKGELIIKNFLGETKERKAKILKNVEVKVQQDIITVSSIDKELASQTSANIETATKIRLRDRRVFQDGIFITEKAGEKI